MVLLQRFDRKLASYLASLSDFALGFDKNTGLRNLSSIDLSHQNEREVVMGLALKYDAYSDRPDGASRTQSS